MFSLPTLMPGYNEQKCLDFCFWRLAEWWTLLSSTWLESSPESDNMDLICSIVCFSFFSFFFFFPLIWYTDPHKNCSVTCIFRITLLARKGFPCGLVVKDLPAKARDRRDVSLSHEYRRSSGVGNGNPLQYFCLGNSVDRGVWQASVHWVTKCRTWFSDWRCTPVLWARHHTRS